MSLAPTEAPTPLLTHADRCDKCGARAFVLVVLRWAPGMPHTPELYFCAHHAHQYSDAIAPYASMVIDERWTLNKHIEDDKGVR
jgi:hypothetical protein